MGAPDLLGHGIELRAEDPDDLDYVYGELRGAPGVSVEAKHSPAEAGDQGWELELLLVACSSGAVASLLQLLRALVESRGPKFVLKVQGRGQQLEIKADTVEEALPLLREMLGEP
ncbi:hypothetical protein ACFO1B_27555 [Dactylosporangium siamense]|uniref:Uncharacterized protein n=1 Tax=Dactylosporangium siamense TaxID=685454 RepID=A0A919UEJ4_9ACTN|nr:hypothetical protein [Dactylosporangium siamense]GIG47683.1 hypothetical protein Dsi01nite_057240 [Dactylosporangium siamense]